MSMPQRSQLASDWLEAMYEAGTSDDAPSSADLSKFVRFCMQCAHEGDLSPIDEVLRDVDVTKVSICYMISMLRSNYRLHKSLQHWEPLRDRVGLELLARGKEPKKLLRGLLDVSNKHPSGALDGLLRVHPTLRN